ncbi:23S rRNA (guanosine(2251)-2'-O)-methyltransferase RlmB [Alsobacter soli]|uniref:23S rRNA (Guanosine(2251)-2'-O)-methyltransferase RlmB n=1 Tax=Alsobacter soli TaxID=2109933 RepID=A0A2T1HS03_9HYPH|nr:23S rRNA (guanosine(2251)-2'-O)-methyltransferase RlmB [Alsobacter soli]PSC04423.1 23S rRNA (guanosine(2251)-2'-O)-methyltransferase RlmB [Alsobacter soli]
MAKQGQGGRSGRGEAPRKGGWDPRQADREPRRRDAEAESRDGRPPRPEARRDGGRKTAEHGRKPDREPAPHGRLRLYGFHSVAEALGNPNRKVHALYATENAAQRLAAIVPNPKVALTLVRPEQIDRMVGEDAVHQGVAADVEPFPALDLHDLPDDALVLVLDQVTDPHNVGAILRSAAAFGAAALVMTERHSPDAAGVLAKTASGGLEHVPIITVGNLAQALAVLGDRGFWRIGLDSEGPDILEKSVASRPVALVLGAEGKGLRRLTRERCDVLARLDMPGAIKSLNVSNAAAVALYALRQALDAKT